MKNRFKTFHYQQKEFPIDRVPSCPIFGALSDLLWANAGGPEAQNLDSWGFSTDG
jgi:hypothetical protein